MSSAKSKKGAKQAADPLTPVYKIEDSPFYQVARLNGRYMFGMEKALKAVGMDIPRWRVLMILNDKSPSSISEISDRSFTRLSTMTRVAQRMAKDGYLELRTADEDARITKAFITKKGEDAVKVIREVASRVFNVAFTDFSDQEITQLNKFLTRAFHNLSILR
ncbi:MAG: MarR family transcriptional regulator [Pseudomonadota bacterium]